MCELPQLMNLTKMSVLDSVKNNNLYSIKLFFTIRNRFYDPCNVLNQLGVMVFHYLATSYMKKYVCNSKVINWKGEWSTWFALCKVESEPIDGSQNYFLHISRIFLHFSSIVLPYIVIVPSYFLHISHIFLHIFHTFLHTYFLHKFFLRENVRPDA